MQRKHIAVTGVFTVAAAAMVAVGIAISGGEPADQGGTRPAGQVERVPEPANASTSNKPAPATGAEARQADEPGRRNAATGADGDTRGDTDDVNQPPPPMPADQAPETAPNNPVGDVEQRPAPAPPNPRPVPGPDPGPIDVPHPADPGPTDPGATSDGATSDAGTP